MLTFHLNYTAITPGQGSDCTKRIYRKTTTKKTTTLSTPKPCAPNPNHLCPKFQPVNITCCPNQIKRSVRILTNITLNGKVVNSTYVLNYCCGVAATTAAPTTKAAPTTTRLTTRTIPTTLAPGQTRPPTTTRPTTVCVQNQNQLCPNWQRSVRCCPGYVRNTRKYNQTIDYDDGPATTRLVTDYCCSVSPVNVAGSG